MTRHSKDRSGPDQAGARAAPDPRNPGVPPAATGQVRGEGPEGRTGGGDVPPLSEAHPASAGGPEADETPAARRARRQAARRTLRDSRRAARVAERAARRAGKPHPAGSAETPAARPATPQGLAADAAKPPVFDLLIVAQGGGIDRQAAVLAASLRRNSPGFRGRLVVAEPQPGGAWEKTDPRMSDAARAALTGLGAEIRPLAARHFGRSYPHGNKIEALALLDPGRPFLFLDSDTLILGDLDRVPFDFTRPSASMRREGTWPQPPLYGPGPDAIWRALYERFGLDMDATLDLSQPDEHWERFLYFNAGWFFGADSGEFGRRFTDWACAVRDDPGDALACQVLDPWLDQIVLPLVIHSLGGGRPGPELSGLDGDVTMHYRNLPLFYARATDAAIDELEAIVSDPAIAPLFKGWEPATRLIAEGQGRTRIRPLFAGAPLPTREQTLRQRLKAADLWLV